MSEHDASGSDEWYFDLDKGVAVRGDQRGRADNTMGPYRTKGEAENWKATVEARNDAWDDADAEWEHKGETGGH
jgi:hypothetical protein